MGIAPIMPNVDGLDSRLSQLLLMFKSLLLKQHSTFSFPLFFQPDRYRPQTEQLYHNPP